MIVRGARARKRWWGWDGRFLWQLPRVRQLAAIATCALRGHRWSRWRRETEEWFEYVDSPLLWAWRTCRRCGLPEHVRPG